MSFRVQVELSGESAAQYDGERFYLDRIGPAGEGGPYDSFDECLGQAIFRCIRRNRVVRVISDQRDLALAMVYHR
jgi:hypothetical protein